ncbi:unnamed protein product, partial [Cyprideis torosa]
QVPVEAVLGVHTRRKDPPRSAIQEDFSSCDLRSGRDDDGGTGSSYPGKSGDKREDRDEEVIKVFDGNISLRRRMFRTICVSRSAPLSEVIDSALKAFQIRRDRKYFFLSDAYSAEEDELKWEKPVHTLTKQEGKRPAVFLRFK